MNNLIKEVQKELTNSNPNYKYTEYCKQIELDYWCKIPDWINEFNNISPIKNCIDIGVAFGTLLLFTHKLSNCKLYATEIEKHLSDDIINRYDIEFYVSNVELQPITFTKDKFDVIIFTEVLEHLKFNPVYTMKKLNEILTDEGSIFFSTPNVSVWGKAVKYKMWQDMPIPKEYKDLPDLGHEYHYHENEIKEIMELSGLKIVKFDYSPLNSRKHINMEIKKV
jgi:2-polyprenyl-3-methyl-5-hydroxy-6-metoxy-1,4-benzoquinol methylase